MYKFLLNMWKARRIDEAYLNKVTKLGRITEKQRDTILATPQK